MKWFNEETVLQLLKDIEKKPIDLECVKEVNGRLVPCLRSGIQIIPPKIENYPSIELPDKYGRLIDADKLASAILSCMDAEKQYSKKDFGLVKMVIYHIVKAPTVLEASE